MWAETELRTMQRLDRAVGEADRGLLEGLAARAARKLAADPAAPHAWEVVPLQAFGRALPARIRSSWVFVLRAETATGAERHPNSHQRMASYRGHGDFQTWESGAWRSHLLSSDPSAALERRWISIPQGVYHQGVVPEQDWFVVSFHTVAAEELIEERGDPSGGRSVTTRHYEPGRGSP